MTEQRRGAPRSEAARVAILEATAHLVRERGYEQLSMEGIAAAAHVGKQTIYRWWGSKSELVAESMLDGFLMPGGQEPPNTGDLRADLAEWLREIFVFVESPENELLLRSLVSAATASREIGARLHEQLGAGSALTRRIDDAAATGEIRADLVGQDVGELLIGTVVLRVLTREPIDAELPGRLVRSILGGSPSDRS
jgi:AcrR family transcriptional regulator